MYDKATLQILYRFCQIPITVFDSEWNQMDRFSTNDAEPKKFEITKFVELKSDVSDKDYCFISYDERIPIGICGCRGNQVFFVLGPVAYGRIDNFDCRNFIKKHNIRECPNVQLEALYALAEYLVGTDVVKEKNSTPIDTAAEQNMITNEELRQIDTFQMNHTYMDEISWFDHIRNGDVEFMKNHAFSQVPSHPVMLANLMKNEEYIAAISISLAARAAIEGGVSSSEGFINNDIYLKKLAECKTVLEVIELKRESQIYFARLVAQHRKKNTMNLYVEKAKNIIASKRFNQISIQEIADGAGISKDYLQKIFKQHEGIPITEYISNVKIEAACNMLKYSDRKIQEISEYLHYGSVSHFSIAFRKKMNLSPKQYREFGRRMTGTIYSCSSMGIKIGSGIGVALCGFLLEFSGFDGQTAVQAASAITVINWSYLLGVALLPVVSIVVFFFVNVEKENEKLRMSAAAK